MYHKSEEIMDKIKISSENNSGYDSIDCWIKDEGDYQLYFFTVIIQDETELNNIWKRVTADIALYFQSELELDIEIWNIYIVFICKNSISKELKYKIEQNKYSTRKLVMERVKFPLSIKDIHSILDKKLFNIEIENRLEVCDETSLHKLIKEHNEELYHLLKKKNSQDIFKLYLEVLNK